MQTVECVQIWGNFSLFHNFSMQALNDRAGMLYTREKPKRAWQNFVYNLYSFVCQVNTSGCYGFTALLFLIKFTVHFLVV